MKKEPIYYNCGNVKFTILIKNNYYHLDFYTPAGDRKRKSTKKNVTKENLQYIKKELIPDILVLLGQEPTTEQKEWTLEEWAIKHFELQEGKNRPQTMRSKKQHFYKHIYPMLGKRLISSINYLDLQTWQTEIMTKINPITKKKYKIETVSTYRAVFFGILDHALKADIILKNYFISVPSPKTFSNLPLEQKAKEINPFTQKEIEIILKNTNGYIHNFIKLMLFTGIRPGEIIAFEENDIDFKRRVIKVTKTRRASKENDPKTKSSFREVDMLLGAKEALEAQLELTKGQEKIFMSMFHKPFYSHDIISKLFRELLIKLEIPPRPLYNLRHTFASQAITKGINILWISKMLGHKNVSITLEVYAKFIVEDDEIRIENIEKLDKILKR
jgi:integrase